MIRFRHLPVGWTWIEWPEFGGEGDVADVGSVMKMTATPRNKEVTSRKRRKTKVKHIQNRRQEKKSKGNMEEGKDQKKGNKGKNKQEGKTQKAKERKEKQKGEGAIPSGGQRMFSERKKIESLE
jgi:hypothetical protein